MAADYAKFLEAKAVRAVPTGIESPAPIDGRLFPFQQSIVSWSLRRGRAALFCGTGTGKTAMQVVWADHVAAHTGKPVLILAPLAVAAQTVREGAKFGVDLVHAREQKDCGRISVVNYERLHLLDPSKFGAVVLDESSILKSFTGATRKELTDAFENTPFKLACTATPAPNDTIEIINHAVFLGIMSGKEIIGLFFVHRDSSGHDWQLKGHARGAFWKWLASWSVAMRKPSDLGFDDGGFNLPPLVMHDHIVQSDIKMAHRAGRLFVEEAKTLSDQRAIRRASLSERVARAVEVVSAQPDKSWVCWVELNDEGNALEKALAARFPGQVVQVAGADTTEEKERRLVDFSEGRVRIMVSKSSLSGFGLNWQHATRQCFVGVGHSFEMMYQAIRRSHRFGVKEPVEVHVVTTDADGAITTNLRRKEADYEEMMNELVSETTVFSGVRVGAIGRQEMDYVEDVARGDGWEMHLGDSVEVIDRIPSDSIGLSVFSPPFPGMYVYSNSVRDIGNCPDVPTMIEHFRHIARRDKLMRVMMPGRLACVHLMQMTSMKSREGYCGIKDYRGAVIQMMQEEGWIYAGEVTIDKNPQVQAVRNKERGLLFKSLATDSSVMRMALADYLLYFRKPGDNPKPIRAGKSKKYNNPDGWITEEEWIEWAAPVWYRHYVGFPGGIRETDVLNVAAAREEQDERHLCPLQIGVIERAVKLWSAPGETVLSPFGGVGSEGVGALMFGRRYIGIELKRSYWTQAQKNLKAAERSAKQRSLFSLLDNGADQCAQ